VRTSRIFARVAGEAIASVFSPSRPISLIWMSVIPPGEVGRVGGVKQGLELGGLHGCQHASGGDPLIRGAGFVVRVSYGRSGFPASRWLSWLDLQGLARVK
jgi:hypothetical protein